jgi:hypothetical protein
MERIWFRRYGWFYLPVSVAGSVILLIAVLFCFNVFLAEDRASHSASDTLYAIYPYFVCTFLLYDWIAERSSRKRHHKPPEP